MLKNVLEKSNSFLKFTWERVKERKFYLIILILLFAYIVFMNKPFDSLNAQYTSYNVDNFSVATDEFLVGETIKHTFVAVDNNLQRIGINSITGGKSISSSIKAIIREKETGREILNQDINLGVLKNGYLEINIENQPNSKGKTYEIELQSLDAVPGNGVSFWKAVNNKESGEEFIENGELKETERLMLSGTYGSPFLLNFNKIAWLFVFTLSLIYTLYFLDNNADEKTFLKIALCFGVLYIIITPFTHPLDESSHIFKAMIISKGQPYVTVTEDNAIGGNVPENYAEFLKANNITLKTILSGQENIADAFSDNDTFLYYPYFSTTLPTGHLIPALALLIGNIVNFPALFSIYLARAFVFAFYTAVTYLAIKNMKYYKSTLVAIALIPVSFWISGTVSLDPILNSSAFLFISICLKYFYMDKEEEGYIKIWELVALIIAAIMLVTCKYLVYTPIVLLFFLIPSNRFKTKKAYIIMLVVSALVGILTILWQFWILNAIPYVEDRNGHTSMEEQIEFILDGNIVNTLKMFAKKMIEVTSLTRLNMYYETSIPTLSSNIGLVLFLAAILDKNKFDKDEKKKKITSMFLISLYVFVLFIALLAIYVTFTQVGANHVQGYQIRYMTIIAPLLLIPIGNLIKIKNDTKNYNMMIVFTMVILNLDQILALLKTVL